MWYWIVKYVLVGPVLWLVCRPRVIGREQVPATGPVIVVANHCAVIDSLLLCLVLPRRLTFVAKREYFEAPGLRGRLQGAFFTAVGQIPVDRSGGARSDAALSTATDLLDGGNAWAIHPEGSRARDGRVHRGHTGAVRVAQRTGAPIVPVALRGTARVNPPGTWLWRPHRVSVIVGRPIGPDRFASTDARVATDAVMAELAVLAGAPYVDAYWTGR
ncbi:MAG: lysophospholipid acyltransferase family protein [Gordonia sp. (in: high G+C Gram-positive bacteria)]